MDSNNEYEGVHLTLPAQPAFVSLAESCVEQAAELLGLSGDKLMKLGLAVEEIFLHLVRVATGEKPISLQVVPGSISVGVHIDLHSDSLNLKAMNIVSSDDVQGLVEREDFDQIGLLLAAHLIDNFLIEQVAAGTYRLSLRQERVYPKTTISDCKPFQAQMPFVLDETPSVSTLQRACILAFASYPDQAFRPNFETPGRFTDLVQGGDFAAFVLKDATGGVCGLILWEETGKESVVFNGPYLFTRNNRREGAMILVEAFIGRVARSPAIIAFTHQATDMLPMEQFELLGALHYCPPEKECLILQAYYRHLHEDHGASVWAHPDLVPFLEKEYERLFLVRTIMTTADYGETRADVSVFGVELDKNRSLAIIRPMLNGYDISRNIGRHLATLQQQDIRNIVFILDLASGWQAEMAGPLMAAGFSAQLIQPLAGRGDCVVFQYAAAAS